MSQGQDWVWRRHDDPSFNQEFFSYKLMDYLEGLLSPEETLAFQSWLHENEPQLKRAEFIRSLRGDLGRMQGVQFSDQIVQDLASSRQYFPFIIERLKVRDWPDIYGLAAQAIVVVALMVGGLVFLPWENAVRSLVEKRSEPLVLATVQRSDSPKEPASAPLFKDDPEKTAEVFETDANKKSISSSNPVNSNPTPTLDPKAPELISSPLAGTTPVGASTSRAGSENSTKELSTGYLFRGTVEITNVEAAWRTLAEKVTELGGRKAGEVELGWKKADGVRYFHLTIPEAKYAELTSFIGQYGKLEISKEKHPRIMPEGIIRLIINVTEKQVVESKN